MRFSLRAPAVTCALVLLATGSALPLAAPASAAGEGDRLWTVVDTDGDGSDGLAYSEGGVQHVVEESKANNISGLTSSADGTRIAYVRDTASREQLVVRDFSSLGTRTITDVSLDGNDLLTKPVLSPDGSTVAWTQVTLDATGFRSAVKRVAVAGGSPVTAYAGYGALGFLDASTLLVQGTTTNVGKSFTAALGSTALQAVPTLPLDADQVALSPDGTRIAWAQDTSSSTSVSTSVVKAGTLTKATNGSYGISGTTSLSRALDNEEPSFSRDGSTVYWIQYDGSAGPGQVLSQPFAATPDMTPAPVTTSADATADEKDVAVTGVPISGAAPASVTPLTAVLTGTAATLRWTLPADASGAVVARTGKSVAAIGSSFVDSGLVLGQTYTYTLTAFDRAGNVAATSSTVQLQAIASAPVVADPTSTASTKTAFPVAFGPTAPTGSAFTVEYVPAGSTTWKPWVTGTSARSGTFPGTAGSTYAFRVHATDSFGNSTPPVTAKAVVPYDQTKAAFSGGTNVASSSSYLGSYRTLTTTASSAKVTLTGNRFQVIGLRCPSCGSFAVYEGSTKVATISSYGSATKVRQVLYTRAYTSTATRTYTIRPLATKGHPVVGLDGFATRR